MKPLIEELPVCDNTIAIETSSHKITYAKLITEVNNLKEWLQREKIESVALYAQNSIEWVLVDLACQALAITLTPLPLFFSKTQINHVISSVNPDVILSDTVLDYETYKHTNTTTLLCYSLPNKTVNIPKNTTKITYTSGSTGSPKGVCLSTKNQLLVAHSLVERINIQSPKHLCLLPLPTLLENIAGVYAPFLSKGTVVICNDEERGFKGSQLVQPQALIKCISQHQPNTLILVPELLQVLIMFAKKGWQAPSSLMFIAVGGSRVAPSLIEEALKVNLPVFQGYGLSECSSVVSLSNANNNTHNTGELLPHITASIINKELVISGNTFLGYLEDPTSWGANQVYTGDIATFEKNTLTIEGRIKNTIINSFGRNISPEWVESELLSTGLFKQAVVVGNNKPFCSALLVPITTDISIETINAALKQINDQLPDYAQIKKPLILTIPMSVNDGLYTENQRPRRNNIAQYFHKKIERIYKENHT